MVFDADCRLQVVFRRLDPLLQTLLPLVARFQEAVESSERKGCSSLIELIVSQIEVLHNVEELLLQLGPPDVTSLEVLADYIALPLNAILHVSATFSKTSVAEICLQDRVLASHIRRLNQSAAHAIQIFVQTSCSSPSPRSLSSARLKDAHIINFLVAIASVLPESSKIKFDRKTLDDGLELFIALMGAIKTLVRVCPGMSLYDKWEGDLVIKIIDFGTSIDLFDNKHLHLSFLDILHVLLMKVKRRDLWQRIFPGVFAYIYGRLVTSGRKTSGDFSAQLETQSLKAIEELLKASICPLVEHSSMNAETKKLQHSIVCAENTRKLGLSKADKNFFLDLETRVADPLGHLIRQSSLCSSDIVQRQMLSLCEFILVESRFCWRSTSLPGNALDTCLTLESQDSRDVLATPLKRFFLTFQNSELAKESWMVPKILSLAEGALSMAKDGNKEMEMRIQLQLLSGYMRYLDANGSANLATSTGVRDSFVELGDVDLESCSLRNSDNNIDGRNSSTTFQFCHLSLGTGGDFRKVLRQYGSSIGWKHGSRLIDFLLSEFCERSFEHLENSSGNFEVDFFHQHIGALVICEEVIRGAYASGHTLSNKDHKRKRHSLQALASSCLPLFLDPLLWNIKTIEESMEAPYPGTPRIAFKGNTVVLSLILKIVGAFFDVMGRDAGILTHVMLCPIIEKASQRKNDVVREIAKEAGLTLATALGFSTLSDLVQRNLSSVLAGLLARLRSISCDDTPNETLLLDAMKAVQWVLLHTDASEEGIRGFAEFLAFIETQFDHLAVFNPLSVLALQDMVALHRAYLDHTRGLFSDTDSDVSHTIATLNRKSGAWMSALSPYKEFSSPALVQRNLENPESLLRHDSEINIVGLHIISRIISSDSKILSKSNLRLQVSASRAMSLAYQALRRFSKKTVHLQDTQADCSATENSILKQTAKSWPTIKARLDSVSEDVFRARIVKISWVACPTSLSPQVELASSEYFLAALLELIAVLCECCGDFMTTRFTKDVWPTIARYLGSIIQSESHRRVKSHGAVSLNKENTRCKTEACDSSDSERQVILSTLDCLGRVYDVLDLPEDVLSAAAHMLVPLLDTCHFGANVGGRAMLTLKRLAFANYDVLWRPLLQLVGPPLPPFPDNSTELAFKTVDVSLHSDQTVLPQKAAEMLSYIKCLPEQAIC